MQLAFQTISGQTVNLETIELLYFRPRIEDVATSLSQLCRFGGHCKFLYTVAQHCVLCAKQAMKDGQSPEVALACLLHDAAEAYVGDMMSPNKNKLRAISKLWNTPSAFDILEDLFHRCVAKEFLPPQHVGLFESDAVKEYDFRMYITESKQLRPQVPELMAWYEGKPESYQGLVIEEMDSRVVKTQYLDMFENLTSQLKTPEGLWLP